MSFGIRISSKLLRGTGLAICPVSSNLKGDGACDLSFGIRVSNLLATILRGTGLAICLLGYEFLPQS